MKGRKYLALPRRDVRRGDVIHGARTWRGWRGGRVQAIAHGENHSSILLKGSWCWVEAEYVSFDPNYSDREPPESAKPLEFLWAQTRAYWDKSEEYRKVFREGGRYRANNSCVADYFEQQDANGNKAMAISR